MIAVLCDENGKTQLGSDGFLRVDGRLTRQNQIEVARQYRERFKKNFSHKYNSWTHVMFVNRISDVPDQYNNKSATRRYKL